MAKFDFSEDNVTDESNAIDVNRWGAREIIKWGWVPGQGIGRQSNGILEPIEAVEKSHLEGLLINKKHYDILNEVSQGATPLPSPTKAPTTTPFSPTTEPTNSMQHGKNPVPFVLAGMVPVKPPPTITMPKRTSRTPIAATPYNGPASGAKRSRPGLAGTTATLFNCASKTSSSVESCSGPIFISNANASLHLHSCSA